MEIEFNKSGKLLNKTQTEIIIEIEKEILNKPKSKHSKVFTDGGGTSIRIPTLGRKRQDDL